MSPVVEALLRVDACRKSWASAGSSEPLFDRGRGTFGSAATPPVNLFLPFDVTADLAASAIELD